MKWDDVSDISPGEDGLPPDIMFSSDRNARIIIKLCLQLISEVSGVNGVNGWCSKQTMGVTMAIAKRKSKQSCAFNEGIKFRGQKEE